MDIFMPMSTTDRHNDMISTFIGDILPLKRKKEIYALQSDCALVHWGERKEPANFALVNISEVEDTSRFTEYTIEYLDYIQPDFMLFKDNPYLKNSKGLRTAGQPDLIVEVWSESNSKAERELKWSLYATSDITEHWYIEQDSNGVQCYMGRRQLPGQCLPKILKTQKGLEFDLRYLAIEN
ncbi:MAG: Uma2 family endonuclease [Oscillospiraceae bacterium]|nr:Uma2 family endonuclease [Oscillospiraceae bacterium]